MLHALLFFLKKANDQTFLLQLRLDNFPTFTLLMESYIPATYLDFRIPNKFCHTSNITQVDNGEQKLY